MSADFLKRNEGMDEVILDPDMPIIDTHHHLFIRPGLRYLLDDYLADTAAGHRVVGTVYVETQAMARRDGPAMLRPLGEIEYALGVGAMCRSGTYGATRVAEGIIGYSDMRAGDAIAEFLDAASAIAGDRFRGIRQIAMAHSDPRALQMLAHRPPADLLTHPGFLAAFRHLGLRGLVFEAAILHEQLPEVTALAAAHPDTTIVVNHLGLAFAMGANAAERTDIFHTWRSNLAAASRQPNLVCKIGGLGTLYWGFGFDRRADPVSSVELAEVWKPYVESAIELFGAERCMTASNFPNDGRSCGFVPLWNALKRIAQGCSRDERLALFHGTAARVYRLDLAALVGAGQAAA
ncbi:MAG: amidohydrolase family protein [Rhodospirillales bacterium]|nr:amidohydrolase family protein [Rhodospirillales bacterium]MDE2198382.1 amidohydrolase family protein [Rhodospirillales bacterium]